MNVLADILARPPGSRGPLCRAFLRWQCRVRQMAMREADGRPDDAIMPALTLSGDDEPMGHILTVMPKALTHDLTPELRHMVQSTNDPAQRRDKAIRFLSSTYYQQSDTFSDTLTATLPPGSPGAARIADAGRCRLDFSAYAQRFSLECTVKRLGRVHPFHQATMWHNLLFNPALSPDTIVLGFTPDWEESSADPAP